MNKNLPLVVLLLFLSLSLQAQYKYQWQMGSDALGLTQLTSPDDIAVDREGNVYVIDLRNYIIKKFNADGKFLFKFGSQGYRDDQFQTPTDLAVDQQGNIYVSDAYKSIKKFSPTGQFLSQIGNYDTKEGEFKLFSGIAVDQQGNVYVSDAPNYCVQKYNAEGKLLNKFGTLGEANGQFSSPGDIAIDQQGNVYVIDQDKGFIQKFNLNGQFLSKFTMKEMEIFISSIAVDTQGSIYINVYDSQDSLYHVRKLSASGEVISEFGEHGIGDGQFVFPRCIAVDTQGNVYVSDEASTKNANHSVQKFSSTGQFLWKIAPLANGQFSSPSKVAVSQEGNVYVLDTYNYRIQVLSPNGQFLFKFGSRGLRDEQFESIKDIDVDIEGNIYVVDHDFVKKFDPTGQFLFKFDKQEFGDKYLGGNVGSIAVDTNGDIYVIAGNQYHIKKFSPTGQLLLQFGLDGVKEDQLEVPTDIAVDEQGNVYVMQGQTNSCVKKFSSSGQFISKIGNAGFGDGQFDLPNGVDIDKEGNIYVIDNNRKIAGFRIQKFSPGGQFLLKFISPGTGIGIALDPQGNIHIADWYNNRIQKFSPVYNYIQGTIYEDLNKDCIQNSNEPALSQSIVIAQPGPYYGISDSLGNYSIEVDTGTYTVEQVLPESNFVKQVCPPANESYKVTFKASHSIVSNKDFGNQITLQPYLTTNVTSDRRRRCFTSNTIISYCNSGNSPANDVKVYLQLPEYVVLVSTDMPFTIDKNNQYIFAIGTVKAGMCGEISVVDSVVCNNPNIRDLTQCTKVWITPSNGNPPSSDWDKSDITLKARCADNGFVKLNIHNTGIGHMADSSSFRIYLDASLVFQHKFKLKAGDSLLLQVPANGQTVRLEADQRPFHPTKQQTTISLEACGVNSEGKVSTGYVAQLPQDDEQPEVAIECLPIIDSYDPNDKLVLPAGVTENHYTPTNRPLDYTIRFQNTGSDYAYKVVVVDTLSQHLDMSTFKVGSVSHVYKLSITGKGRPVLTFTFDNINLPDSTRDQLGSNGFIKFSIKPVASLIEKTVIENYADIFFDFNEPVRTNTVFNSIYDLPARVATTDKVIICQTNSIASAGANRSYCEQDTVYLQANSPAFGKGKWKLVRGTASIRDLIDPNSLVTNLGYGENIFVWKVATNSCFTDSTSSKLTIYRRAAPETPVITQKGIDSLFCNINGTSYEWYKEGIRLEATTQQIKVSENGNYTVKVGLEECHSSLSEAISYQKVPTGIEEYASQIKVYPNPATGTVFVELPLEWQAKLTLVDGMGRELKVSMTTNQQKCELSLTDIKGGVYTLHIETLKGIFVKKLIVR